MIDWEKLLSTEIGDEAFKATIEMHGLTGSIQISQTNWRGETKSLLPEAFWKDVAAECERRAIEILRQPEDLSRSEREFIAELIASGFVRANSRPRRKWHPLEGAARWVRLRAAELRKEGIHGARERAMEEVVAESQAMGRNIDVQQLDNYMRRSRSSK